MEARIYQPYFLFAIASVLGLWALVGASTAGGSEFVLVALWTYILSAVASLFVFAFWQFASKNEKVVFFGSYACWFVFVPLVLWFFRGWTALAYAYIITKCCEDSWFLHVALWTNFHRFSTDLLTVVFYGLLLYICVWHIRNLKTSGLRIASKAIGALSILLFGVGLYALFSDLLP